MKSKKKSINGASERITKLFNEMSEWEWCDAWKDGGNWYSFQNNITGQIKEIYTGEGLMEDALEKLQEILKLNKKHTTNQSKYLTDIEGDNIYTALIDNGKFSGKPEYVYLISKSEKHSKEWYELINGGYCYETPITKEEYNYLKNIDNYIEVGYNKYGKTIQDKFFY